MIFLLRDLPPKFRWLVGFGCALVLFQWWVLPAFPQTLGETWLWSINPARFFPIWFRIVFPLFLIFAPLRSIAQFISSSSLWKSVPSPLKAILGLVFAGTGFWVLRVGTLELGDAKLILDHFLSLTTYASVREPLESILHTDFARFLFYGWGVHPRTSFQIQSCLIGILTLTLCTWGFLRFNHLSEYRSWIGLILLIGPIHLFFGYIEWYSQLAAGILIFEVFSIIHWRTGRGLWIALLALVFATCSHLVGFALVPSALLLIVLTRSGSRRWIESLFFLGVLIGSVALTLWWIKSSIKFDASVEATSDLFTTLLPLMREDNPDNPPGSWTYPWLSANHLIDLVNEIILCGLFALGVLTALRFSRDQERGLVDPRMKWFFGTQLLACGTFLLLWNPWLGFPTDWDLFSFFAWPLLAFALFLLSHLKDREIRNRILWIAGYPAFSIVFAWVVHYHQPDWITHAEARAYLNGTLVDRYLEEAARAKEDRNWDTAFEKVEEVLATSPHRRAEAFSIFDAGTLQKMSEDWGGDIDSLIPLAVDFEVMSASPKTRFLVMDCWGRLFFQEGGYFNDWSIHGLPDIPERRAVDFEIVPWRRAAVILEDNGNLYEVPVSSWVHPNPSTPRETTIHESPLDREPKFVGNFYSDEPSARLGRGQHAVDLALDYWNERLVVLDSTGNLAADGTGTNYNVTQFSALSRCDVEVNYNGEFAFVTDHFGGVTSWPGMGSSIQVIHQIGWPAITDSELTRGGNDLYLLDGQGGVSPFSRLESALIDPTQMIHYFPTGEPLAMAPYIQDPIRYFIDLEILPGERSFYKMTSNFRIHFSEQIEEASSEE